MRVRIIRTGEVGELQARYSAHDGTTLLVKTPAGERHIDMPVGAVESDYFDPLANISKIRLVNRPWTFGAYDFVVEGDDGAHCRFSIYLDTMHLASFGGSRWPAHWPDFFDHVGPDKGMITARSGPQLNAAGRAIVRETIAVDNAFRSMFR